MVYRKGNKYESTKDEKNEFTAGYTASDQSGNMELQSSNDDNKSKLSNTSSFNSSDIAEIVTDSKKKMNKKKKPSKKASTLDNSNLSQESCVDNSDDRNITKAGKLMKNKSPSKQRSSAFTESSEEEEKPKKSRKKKKKHRDQLKLQTYDYYGEQCFEIVKLEVPLSDDDKETVSTTLQSNKSMNSYKSKDISIATTHDTDKYADTSEVHVDDKDDEEKSSVKESETESEESSADVDDEVSSHADEQPVAEETEETPVTDIDETASASVTTAETSKDSTECSTEQHEETTTTTTNESSKDSTECSTEQHEETTTTTTNESSKEIVAEKNQVKFKLAKKIFGSKLASTMKKKPSNNNTDLPPGKKSVMSFNMMAKNLSRKGRKQCTKQLMIRTEELQNNESTSHEKSDDTSTSKDKSNNDMDTLEKIVEEEEEEEDEEEEEVVREEVKEEAEDAEKAVTILDAPEDKKGDSPIKNKHAIDQICRDDLTHLISALTLGSELEEYDDEESLSEKNAGTEGSTNGEKKGKLAQQEMVRLLNILQSNSDLGDNIKNRYSLSRSFSQKSMESMKGSKGAAVLSEMNTKSLIETLKAYNPEEKTTEINEDLNQSILKLSSQLKNRSVGDASASYGAASFVSEKSQSTVEQHVEKDSIVVDDTSKPNEDTNVDNTVTTSTQRPTLTPIETTTSGGDTDEAPTPSPTKKKKFPLSPTKKKKFPLSPTKGLEKLKKKGKKFVRFREQLESPRSPDKSSMLYETIKMIIVTASIILGQSGDTKSAEEASALMLEEELIKCRSTSGSWIFKNFNGRASEKKHATINATETASLLISALSSGIGTIQASELAVQTLRSKGYKVTEQEPRMEGDEEEEDIVVIMPGQNDAVSETEAVESNNPEQQNQQINETNSTDLVLETYPGQTGCFTAACWFDNAIPEDVDIPKEISASPSKRSSSPRKNKKQYIEENTTVNDSTTEASSSILVEPRYKNKRKKNIPKKTYHAPSETESEFSSQVEVDSSQGKSSKDESLSYLEDDSRADGTHDKEQETIEDGEASAGSTAAQKRLTDRCSAYDQPGFDDYMSKIYYQMMDDVEKYKMYRDVVNVCTTSKSILQGHCCGRGGAAVTTIGDSTIEDTSTSTRKEQTMNDDKRNDANELEEKDIVDNNSREEAVPVDVNETIINTVVKPIIKEEDIAVISTDSKEKPLTKQSSLTKQKSLTKQPRLKKQPSMNSKLFKGFKKALS